MRKLIIGCAILLMCGYGILFLNKKCALDGVEEIGNEERPDEPTVSAEELAHFNEYVASRLNSSGLKSAQTSGESSYAKGKLTGTWNAKLTQTGWYGYRVDNSAYDSLRNVFYVVSYAGHLYKLEYEDEVRWTLLNHKVVMNPSNNGTANPVFTGTFLEDNTFRLIRSNDGLGRMEYSDDEGLNWTAASGANLAQSWANQIFEITNNGTKRIVLHTYYSNYHYIYYSDDNGATYTKSNLSFPISTYDMRIAKPFNTNEVYMWVWGKSSKKIDVYKYNTETSDFELQTNSSSTLTGSNLSSAAATYVNGKYHFYLATSGTGYAIYYSSDEGVTWTQKVAEKDKPFEVICADKPNMLISGFEDMKLSTDYGATWNGYGYKLGWDMQHMRTYEKKGGGHITLAGLDFGCYVSETPEDKDSYTWCNNGAWYAMHYDVASSQNFNSIYMGNQDRGATAYEDTGVSVHTKDIDGTDVLRVCFSKRETSVWYWFYYGRIKHKYNFATGNSEGAAVYDGLGNWWAAPIIASPNPDEDAIYAAYGSKLQKFTYDESSNTITKSEHEYDFESKYSSEIGSFGYSELNRDLWYVALNNGAFIYSKDGGVNWTRSRYYGSTPKSNDQYYNYPKNQSVIKASRIDTNKVYYAGVGNLFLISEDNGNIFTNKANGLSISRIRDFALSPDEQYIFAACGYGGAWVYSVEDNYWYQMSDDPIPSVDFTDVEFISGQNCVRFGTYGSGIIEFKLDNQFYAVNGPSGLSGVINSDNKIELSWTDNGADEDGYYIEKATHGEFERVDTLGANSTSYVAPISDFEETLYYRVKAFKDNQTSCNSNVVILNTPKQGYLSTNGWSVIDFSSEETSSENSPVTHAVDNNTDTYWHTLYSSSQPGHPHYLVVDLGEEKNLVGFRYLPRQDGAKEGTIADYALYVSNDTENWGDPVVSGKFAATLKLKEAMFDAAISGRYVKLEALSSITGSGQTSVAEFILLYQMVPPETPTGFSSMIINDTSVLLRWQDNSLNTESYVVEQWINGKFEVVATVDASKKYFIHADQKAATEYQYRVKAVNEGGDSGYTEILNVKTGGTSTDIQEEESDFNVYPNPFTDYLTVKMPASGEESKVRLIDAHGRVVLTRIIDPGETTISINTSDVGAGMYILELVSGKEKETKKVVKRK